MVKKFLTQLEDSSELYFQINTYSYGNSDGNNGRILRPKRTSVPSTW